MPLSRALRNQSQRAATTTRWHGICSTSTPPPSRLATGFSPVWSITMSPPSEHTSFMFSMLIVILLFVSIIPFHQTQIFHVFNADCYFAVCFYYSISSNTDLSCFQCWLLFCCLFLLFYFIKHSTAIKCRGLFHNTWNVYHIVNHFDFFLSMDKATCYKINLFLNHNIMQSVWGM